MTAQEKGEKGEKFFADKLVFPFFYDGGLLEDIRTGKMIRLENITANKVEGDYRIIDGTVNPSIVEVKSLYGIYNNLMIEVRQGEFGGWYQYCKKHGIDFVVHNRYRDEADSCPVYSILLFFPRLAKYVDEKRKDETWVKRHTIKTHSKSSCGTDMDYVSYGINYLNELVYDAECCMKIAYPKSVDDKHCMTLPEIINRTCIPESYFFKVEQILTPWR